MFSVRFKFKDLEFDHIATCINLYPQHKQFPSKILTILPLKPHRHYWCLLLPRFLPDQIPIFHLRLPRNHQPSHHRLRYSYYQKV